MLLQYHDNTPHTVAYASRKLLDLETRYSTVERKLLLLLLLLKKIGNVRPGEGDCHPISPKTPAPHYQPIEEKKRKGK